MRRILKNIHLLFWGAIPIFLLYGFLNYNESIDINVHDTMFVIARIHLAIFISTIFFVTGFGYFSSYKRGKFKLNRVLTLAHVLITFLGILLAITFSFKNHNHIGWNTNVNEFYKYENYRLLTIFITVLAQLLFIVNLAISFLSKKIEL